MGWLPHTPVSTFGEQSTLENLLKSCPCGGSWRLELKVVGSTAMVHGQQGSEMIMVHDAYWLVNDGPGTPQQCSTFRLSIAAPLEMPGPDRWHATGDP